MPPLIGCTTYRKTAQHPTVEVFGLMPSYIEAITAAGGLPIMIPLGLSERALEDIFHRLDGLLLPGGGDIDPQAYAGNGHETVADIDPDRDRVEFTMARLAVEHRKPVLAICRGHQVLNVALGGSLWEDVRSQMPGGIVHDHDHLRRQQRPHDVTIQPDSCLASYIGRTITPVNSMHHQGVRTLAPRLRPVATAPDGLVEGVEVIDHPFGIGVQWHPENLVGDDPAMAALFAAFIAAAAPQSVRS